MRKRRTIQAWVCLKSLNPILWEWWCYPFPNVRMMGFTKTPIGAKNAAKRTIERLNTCSDINSYKAEVEILRPTPALLDKTSVGREYITGVPIKCD